MDKISIVHECLYNYRRHMSSITFNRNSKHILDSIYALDNRIDFLKNREEEELYICSLRLYIGKILAGYYDLYIMGKKIYKKELKDLKKKLKSVPLKTIKKINFPQKVYIEILLFRLSPVLYCKIKCIKKRAIKS